MIIYRPSNKDIDMRKFPWQVNEFQTVENLHSVLETFYKYKQKYGEDYIIKEDNDEKDMFAVFTRGDKVVMEHDCYKNAKGGV